MVNGGCFRIFVRIEEFFGDDFINIKGSLETCSKKKLKKVLDKIILDTKEFIDDMEENNHE